MCKLCYHPCASHVSVRLVRVSYKSDRSLMVNRILNMIKKIDMHILNMKIKHVVDGKFLHEHLNRRLHWFNAVTKLCSRLMFIAGSGLGDASSDDQMTMIAPGRR